MPSDRKPPKTKSFLTPDFVRSLPRDHEVAITLCSRKGKIIPGGTAEGDWDHVEPHLTCPKRSKVIGSFHTHPGGDPRASKADVLFQQEHEHPLLCTGKPETGEYVCRKLKKGR